MSQYQLPAQHNRRSGDEDPARGPHGCCFYALLSGWCILLLSVSVMGGLAVLAWVALARCPLQDAGSWAESGGWRDEGRPGWRQEGGRQRGREATWPVAFVEICRFADSALGRLPVTAVSPASARKKAHRAPWCRPITQQGPLRPLSGSGSLLRGGEGSGPQPGGLGFKSWLYHALDDLGVPFDLPAPARSPL